jgi:O-antigen/teichoic acid export membrane protein
MNFIKKILQLLTANILIIAQGLIITPFIIRTSGPKDFGDYIIFITIGTLIFNISSLGTGFTAKRQIPSCFDLELVSKIFYPQFWFHILSGQFLSLLIALIIYYLFGSDLEWGIDNKWLIFLLPIYVLSVTFFSQMLDYNLYTHKTSIFSIGIALQPYLFLILFFGYLYINNKVAINYLILFLILSNFLTAFYLSKNINFTRTKLIFFSIPSIFRESKLGISLVFAYVCDFLILSADKFIIPIYFSSKELGMYIPAFTIGSFLIIISKVFSGILYPHISHLIDNENNAAAKNIIENCIKFFVIIMVPFILASLVMSEDILAIYVGSEISKSIWVNLPILAISTFFNGLIILESNILMVRMKNNIILHSKILSIIIMFLCFIIGLYFIKKLVIVSIGIMIGSCICYLLIKRENVKDAINPRISYKFLLLIIFSSILMTFSIYFLNNFILFLNINTRVAIQIIFGFILYINLIYFNPYIRKDFNKLIIVLKKIKNNNIQMDGL